MNTSDRKVRKIHRLAIGSNMYIEAILIPSLNLKVTEAVILDCFNRYSHIKTNTQWAQNDDGLRGPVGKLLLGKDRTPNFY